MSNMNPEGRTKPSDYEQRRIWARPLQVGNGAQETAVLSSNVKSLDRTRLKRTRAEEPLDENHPDGRNEWNERSECNEWRAGTVEPLKPVFQLRSLSLDRGAIAPGLANPTAPFAKSARKKAYVSAIYYSECFLRNIEPREADLAAFDIQNQYTKWWVQSKKSKAPSTTTNSNGKRKKRRRLEAPDGSSSSSDDVTTIATETTFGTKTTTSMDPSSSPIVHWDPEVVNLLKERMVEHLQKTGGDTTTTEFQHCLEQLQTVFSASSHCPNSQSTDGTWLTLSKPTFSECQGRNKHGEYLYTLGRMAFDMFRPTHLRCSIRAVMNNIRVMDAGSRPQSLPSRLAKQLLRENNGNSIIRHYDIVVAFTIEANQTRRGTAPSGDDDFVITRPIRGLITNHGYMVADPDTPHRSSIWFSGGSMEVQDEIADAETWKQIFDESLAPRRDPKAIANLLAAKLLLGAHTTTTTTEDSNTVPPIMSYFFKRPIGGHGEVFCDDIYVDETLRITRGHRGSIFVSTRVPTFQEPQQG